MHRPDHSGRGLIALLLLVIAILGTAFCSTPVPR